MEQKYKICIIIFIIFLILDFIMIRYVNNQLYNDQFNLINNVVFTRGASKDVVNNIKDKSIDFLSTKG
jgi:hypothetical protein